MYFSVFMKPGHTSANGSDSCGTATSRSDESLIMRCKTRLKNSAVKSDRGVSLFSRRRKSFDHHYPLIVEALAELPEGTVVDGQIVALDESGRPNFNLLQNFRSEAARIHYFIFDLLVCQNRDLTRLPLSEPRGLLKSFLKLRPGYNA